MTPDWQGYAVNGILTNLVNGRAVMETGIVMWKDYIITLPGFLASIIGIMWIKETFFTAMINLHHRPLVIFGKSSFVKDNDLNACLFCDLLL